MGLARIGAGAAILAGALLLRLHGIDAQGFWIDEHASILMAGDGPFPAFSRIQADVHPPLYFSLLHYWMRAFGDSETALRMLSTVASVATIGFLYRLGWLLYGPRTAWLASVVAATSLLQIYYAQEARSYAWLMLFTVLSTDALVRWRLETRTRHAALYALWTAALLYTHYFSLFFIASQAIYVALVAWAPGNRCRRAVGWILAITLAGLFFLPWVGALLEQMREVQKGFWISEPSIRAWIDAPLLFLSWWGPWSGDLRISLPSIGLYFLGLAALFSGIAFLSTSWTSQYFQKFDSAIAPWESTLLLFLWLIVPTAMGLQSSLLEIDIFSFRNVTVSACAALLLGSAICGHLKSPLARSLFLAALLAPSLAQMPRYYSEPHKDQWCDAASFVEAQYQPSTDAFVFDAPFIRYPFLACSTLEDVPSVPPLSSSAPPHARIWLVRGYAGPRSRSTENISGWGYAAIDQWHGVHVEVELFERSSDTLE